jgi:hypothetical protein
MTTEKTEALSLLSDIHKDAYGYRPRGSYNVEAMTVENIQEEIDRLHELSMENMRQEEAYALLREVAFKELVQDTIGYGAGDEKTALKWLFDAYKGDAEVDHFEVESFLYHNGIMHTEYGKKVQPILIAIYGD